MTVSSSTNFKGSFKQGTSAILTLNITDFDGTALNPSFIEYTISGPIENVSESSIEEIETGTPIKIDDGFYGFEWGIDAEQSIGTYNILWEFMVNGTSLSETQTVVITEGEDAPSYYNKRRLAFKSALEQYLICAQRIPVYYEQSRPSRDRLTYQFSFPNWNQSTGIRVYRNKEIINDGVSVNYSDGSITFDNSLIAQEIVNVDYNFKWFSDDDLFLFLENAVQATNAYPPASAYRIENIPDRYIPTVLYGASKDALRQFMMCLQFQQPQQVFGGSEAAQKAFSNFETLKQNYEKNWESLIEQKKYGPYVGLTQNIITPEFTLPGGRSRWFRFLYK